MLKKLLAKIKPNCFVTINRKTFQSKKGNVSIDGNNVYIDGIQQDLINNLNNIKVIITGDCDSIECSGEVIVHGNVYGDIDAGNSVKVEGNSVGNIDAGNSISIKGNHSGGNVDAGNIVKIGEQL